MSFGEATIADLMDDYQAELKDSYSNLGTDVVYIRTQGSSVKKDRLGSTVQVKPDENSQLPLKAGLAYNPSNEIRNKIGLKGNYDAILTLRAVDVKGPIDKENDYFLVNKVKFKISDFKLEAIALAQTYVYQIGLIAN